MEFYDEQLTNIQGEIRNWCNGQFEFCEQQKDQEVKLCFNQIIEEIMCSFLFGSKQKEESFNTCRDFYERICLSVPQGTVKKICEDAKAG